MKKIILTLGLSFGILTCLGQILYVSNSGNDNNPGSLRSPFKTIERGVKAAIGKQGKAAIIEILAGSYALSNTIMIDAKDYKVSSLTIKAHNNGKVTISGAQTIAPRWTAFRGRIWAAKIDPGTSFDAVFMNGRLLSMARYPNLDTAARVFNGTAADAISDDRVQSWKDPAGGYIHALHQGEWGDFHYLITGKDEHGKLRFEGGWQNNRPSKMHPKYRYVENIFEELDAPGEWYYEKRTRTIYLIPPIGTNIQNANFIVTKLTSLLQVHGSMKLPVKNLTIEGINFTQTSRSFMEVKEPLLRSDWAILRSGAILLDGTENISINGCSFYDLGGSAVFLSNYNKNDKIINNHIHDIGANGIAFVGDPDAVRSPSFAYEQFVPYKKTDMTPGPKTRNFPQHCTASGNLIHNSGMIEKQSAGVEISMSADIKVSHNTIYKVPRAGINVSEGTFGGHLIEFNDVFETVLETGDHGAFNSWGRDRYWRPERQTIDSIVGKKPGIELLDIIAPIVIRNNRFRCDHGWDIDLDDGSSNYLIYNNVCLSGGLKLREGYQRTVYNNIIINNTFHPHVWLKNSRDIFRNNIVSSAYAPILMENWGKEIDHNFFLSQTALINSRKAGNDENSTWGNPGFVNESKGDYRLKDGSKPLLVGFKNFNMYFGVTSPNLKKLAPAPKIDPLVSGKKAAESGTGEWLGAIFKNIETLGERSAAGLHDDNGALLTELRPGSLAEKNGLKKGDVIILLDGNQVLNVTELLKVNREIRWKGKAEVTVIRNQNPQKIALSLKD